MNIQSFDLEQSRAFYVETLGLSIAMDMGWIVTLTAPSSQSVQLSLLTQDATAPVTPALSLEVDDVEIVHAAVVARGYVIVYPLTSEPWGVRRFFVRDPNGLVVNVLSHEDTPPRV